MPSKRSKGKTMPASSSNGGSTRRARRADPEVALALVIHRRTGIAIDWIQEALDERFRPEGRTPGKLAEKVRALEKRLRTDEKSGR
jgi:hypothetical protein